VILDIVLVTICVTLGLLTGWSFYTETELLNKKIDTLTQRLSIAEKAVALQGQAMINLSKALESQNEVLVHHEEDLEALKNEA
jgi:hypothetical protein